MPTHAPIDGSVGGSGGGGGGLPTLGAWAAVDATLKLSTDPNEGSLTPVPSGYIYDPKFDYCLAVSFFPTGTWSALGALPTITTLFPATKIAQGNLGEGIGEIVDPVNGTISLFESTGSGTGDFRGAQMVDGGGPFGGPATGFTGLLDLNFNNYGFRASDGALCTQWFGNGGGEDAYFVAFARQVEA